MTAHSTAAAHSETDQSPARWWTYARSNRIFCGPRPCSHHIAGVRINETGFVECRSKIVWSPEVDRVQSLFATNQRDEAIRLKESLIRRGIPVPNIEEMTGQRAVRQALCPNIVFIMAIRGSGVIVARVAETERSEMERLATPAEMLEYLGIFNVGDEPIAPPAARAPGHHHHRR